MYYLYRRITVHRVALTMDFIWACFVGCALMHFSCMAGSWLIPDTLLHSVPLTSVKGRNDITVQLLNRLVQMDPVKHGPEGNILFWFTSLKHKNWTLKKHTEQLYAGWAAQNGVHSLQLTELIHFYFNRWQHKRTPKAMSKSPYLPSIEQTIVCNLQWEQ